MKHIRLFLSALAAILLLSVPAFAEGGTAEVRTSDEFRAALADPDVDRLVYYGQLIVENDPGGDNFLDAGLKIIEPADRSSDGDNLLFERGVTMLHVSRHRGNTEDPDSQSVRMIYGRDYNGGYADYGLLMDAAQGWVGWYEYHDPNSRDDEDAGYRLCYMLYCGSWQDAVDTAADLTAGDWFHPCSGPADENQIIFLQFGANCHGEDGNIVIDRDIDVTCYMELLGGQNLTVTNGAHLTAGALDLLLLDGEGGFHHWGLSSLHVEDGSKVTIHRWEGEDGREDGPYLEDHPYLGAQGEIRIDNLETGLEYDENADIWCEYRPFLFFQDSPLEWDGPAGAWDELGGADSVTVENGSAEGFLYAAWFGRRELEDGSLSPAGWWFDWEGAETAVVTDMDGNPSDGLILDWTEEDGQTRLTAVSPGDYLIFRYHDPDRGEEWGWPEGWIPNENGTDAFGTDILGAEGVAIHVRVESLPQHFLFMPEFLENDGPAGSWDEKGGADSVTVEDGTAEGYLYAAWFGRREENGPEGWWFDREGAETAVVTDTEGRPSGGLILDWAGENGLIGLTAVSPGEYLIYRYHDPDRWQEWGWPEDWIPNENGTDAPGTDILGAEGMPIRVLVEAVPERTAGLEAREDGAVLVWPDLPRRALDRTARAFAVPGEGEPLPGEANPDEGSVSFAERPEPGWGLILVDEDFRPVCGKLEITE